MKGALDRALRFVAQLLQAQHRDQLLLRAAALAYTSLLSLVPLLTVALVTVGRVQPERAELVVRAIATVLPFSPARVQATLTAFAERTASLGWLAIVISVLVTMQAFYQIEEVINAVWGVPHRRSWQLRIVSFVTVLVWGPLLLTALFSFLYWLSSRSWYHLVSPLARPLPAIFSVVTLTALYRWVPHTRVPLRAALSGAAVATGALAMVHVGFQAYLDYAANLNVIYGSLTLVLLFLISLLLFWLAVLLGVEASWLVGRAPAVPPDHFQGAVLKLLIEAYREGSVSAAAAAAMLGDSAENALSRLQRPPEILTRTTTGWQLARNAEDIVLAEVRERVSAPVKGEKCRERATLTLATLAKETELNETDMEQEGLPVGHA